MTAEDHLDEKTRAEAAETALREVERALRSQDWSIERLEHQRRTALSIAQTAIKRARTTTTEEVPHA